MSARLPILAFDVGAKRIGVAISRSGIIAEPLTTVAVTPEGEDAIRSLIQSEAPAVIVVGRPEREGSRSALIDAFFDQLRLIVDETVAISVVDETLTTKEAERLSRSGTNTDALAATLILEQYLAESGVMSNE